MVPIEGTHGALSAPCLEFEKPHWDYGLFKTDAVGLPLLRQGFFIILKSEEKEKHVQNGPQMAHPKKVAQKGGRGARDVPHSEIHLHTDAETNVGC